MTLTIVTSFNRHIWNNHGKTCLASWLEHIKGAYALHIYIDGPIPADLPKSPNVYIHWLDTEPEYTRFLTETRDVTPNPNIPPEHKFRFEFRRFWPKVFAIKDSYAFNNVLWLDADILFKKDLSVERILEDLKERKNIVCLDRGPPWNYMDSGYLLLRDGWNGNFDKTEEFVDALYNIYTTKTIFRFTEWHDAFLMSQVMNILWGSDKDTYVKSLSGLSSSLHPLNDSWLSEYMIHLKGTLKAHAKEQPDLEIMPHLKGHLKNTVAQPEPVQIEAPRRTDV